MSFNIEDFKNDVNTIGVKATMRKYHIGRDKLHEICDMFDIEIRRGGRPPVLITQEECAYVVGYKQSANIGYQAMAKVAKRDPAAPKTLTTWRCKVIFEHLDLYQYIRPYKPDAKEEHPNRFVAKYVNQAWHTDLHYLEPLPEENNKQLYLIAFIDDRSRYIIHYQVLEQKTSLLAMNALAAAFEKGGVPKTMIMDNGTEFRGPFEELLVIKEVELHRTHPYTPEENGKLERWWETIERSKTRPLRGEYLDWMVNQYNTMWEQSSLKELTGTGTTPAEAFASMPRYSGQPDAGFIYSQ